MADPLTLCFWENGELEWSAGNDGSMRAPQGEILACHFVDQLVIAPF